jgi:hypothetical protein
MVLIEFHEVHFRLALAFMHINVRNAKRLSFRYRQFLHFIEKENSSKDIVVESTQLGVTDYMTGFLLSDRTHAKYVRRAISVG